MAPARALCAGGVAEQHSGAVVSGRGSGQLLLERMGRQGAHRGATLLAVQPHCAG